MKPPLQTEVSGLERVPVTRRAANPQYQVPDSGGLQHEGDEQGAEL